MQPEPGTLSLGMPGHSPSPSSFPTAVSSNSGSWETGAEELYGMDIHRQKHFFSFDRVMYQSWAAGSDVWLKSDDADDSADDDRHAGDDSDPKSSTLPPHFHPKTAKSGTQKNAHIDDHSGKENNNREICTDSTGVFHSIRVSFSNQGSGRKGDGGISDPEESGTQTVSTPFCPLNSVLSPKTAPNEWKTKWNTGETCGRREPKNDGRTLPGILDHRDFERSSVILGHCTLCGDGAAICEACYIRLIQEWNRENGAGL